MNFSNQLESDDDEWFEGLESDEDNIEMGSAVQINDPISTLGLKAPLMVEIGTNMKTALDLLQGKEQNCILIVKNNVYREPFSAMFRSVCVCVFFGRNVSP